jgi:hypothetical protein
MDKRKVFIIVIVILTAAVNMPYFERFTITDVGSGNIVFKDRVDKYREFYTSFTHSVNRTPVNEYYEISGDKLILVRATFSSYGAGMPEAGEYGSGKPKIIDGIVQMENINKEFKRFVIFAGTYANHSLNTMNSKIYFSSFVEPQSSVAFEVKKISIAALARYYIMNR